MTDVKKIDIPTLYHLRKLKEEIMAKWQQLEDIPGVFRYKINVRKQKILPGRFKFVVEVINFILNSPMK